VAIKINQIFQRGLVFHPFLFAFFPILSLYTNNLDQVSLGMVVRPGLFALTGAGLGLFSLRFLLKSWKRAGLGTSLIVLLFFTFGPLQRILSGWLVQVPLIWITTGLACAWIVLFVIGLWMIRRVHAELERLTLLFNWVSIIAISTCLWGVGSYTARIWKAGGMLHRVSSQSGMNGLFDRLLLPLGSSNPRPDIYWIVLDGYGRADVLNEIYGLDNSDFIRYLEKRGFYVAGQAHSNYAQTALSLSSAINMNYLDQLVDLNPQSEDRQVLFDLINHSLLLRFLKERGYQTIAFNNAYPLAQLHEVDTFLERPGEMTIFERTTLAQSLGEGPQLEALRDDYRAVSSWQAAQVKRLAGERADHPRFIFVHIVLPHPPFLFPRDPNYHPALTIGDGSDFPGPRAEYIEGYRKQLLYTNDLVKELIDAIQAGPSHDPVIILQGDHGPGSHLNWASYENTCVRERLSILNAYYFPGRKPAGLSPDITPVNSFRILLNTYFNARLPLLPNHSFFSIWRQPYGFYDAQERLETKCDKN
jgi:hypothetical protein